jgi:FAD/FMN-containing dehydrogenase
MSTTADQSVTIDNPADLAALVRDCIDKKLPIVDYGVGHELLGNPAPTPHVKLTQQGGIIEHYQRDLTVRVSAGMTIGDLQTELEKTNQFLPIDCDPDLTVGEIITHNVYGPLRKSYGGPRDLLLGLRYIDGHGRDIHVGGRTVKNVAGYDLTRFMVGSLGQFGLVYEATLRTYAIPPRVLAVFVAVSDPAALSAVTSNWMLTAATPTWMALHRVGDDWQLSLGYYGSEKATQVQFDALGAFIKQAKAGLRIGDSGPCALHDDLAERSLQRTWRRRVAAMVKIVVPPAQTGALCNELVEAEPALRLSAVPSLGRIFAGGDDITASRAIELDALITEKVAALGGNRIWLRRPQDAHAIVPFGPMQTDWPVLNKLHRTMDPHQIFNPGRLFPVECPQS